MDEPTEDSAEIQRLLDQLLAGELGALDKLLGYYQGFLRQVIEMRLDPRVRRRVDASDVLQETQMEANRRLNDYLENQPVPFRLWLRQIAQDQILKAHNRHVSSKKRSLNQEVSLPERSSLLLAKQLLAGGSTPSEHVAKKEQADKIRKALSQLLESDREIILMANFEKLASEEIGYLLGISPDATRMRYTRAIMRLSKILQANGQSSV